MLLVLASIASAAAAPCPAPSSSADVLDSLDDAERAFSVLDLAGFRSASEVARAQVGCLDETLPRPLIARLHRLEGLRAFVDEDAVGASAAFASARAIEPMYRFPEALVPAGHPVRERYEQQDPASGGETPVPAPDDGQIEVDGRPGVGLPRTRPSVVQWVQADGEIPASAYLGAGAALFEYPTKPVGEVPEPVPPVVRRAHTSVPLAIGAGVLLAAAGGAYALAADARSDFLDTTDRSELEPLQQKTNQWFVGSMATGGAGVALGVTAVLVGKW